MQAQSAEKTFENHKQGSKEHSKQKSKQGTAAHAKKSARKKGGPVTLAQTGQKEKNKMDYPMLVQQYAGALDPQQQQAVAYQ